MNTLYPKSWISFKDNKAEESAQINFMVRDM